MSIVDFIPHGLVVGFGTVVSYIFRDHVKTDDKRFDRVVAALTNMSARQTEISDKMANNHTEILQTLLRDKNT
jgi:hypothetical protein